MNTQQTEIHQVAEPMRGPVRQYADQVKALAGTNALSLTLFGPIVAGTFDKRLHTVRNVLVLAKVDLDMLRQLAQSGAKLGKVRISAPLIMTPEYIKASLDTFPVELIEIVQFHLILFGEDYFNELSLSETHVRLQCEREVKSILIAMRQGLLASTGRDKFLSAMDTDIMERVIRVLRGLLWIKGQRDAKSATEVLSRVENQDVLGHTLSGVRAALEPSAGHGWDEFQSLYRDIEVIGRLVDAW
jgi:hypothetical protein